MKKTSLIVLLFVAAIFFSCKEDLNPTEDTQDHIAVKEIKSGFDNGYFEWDQVSKISVRNQFNNILTDLELPWRGGGADMVGIPRSWIDENAYDPNFKNRKYSRDKGWYLVYSNINEYTSNKYFVLYNQNTGILRFFFYALASSSGQGSTVSFWGVNINTESSLFNFTSSFAYGINKKVNFPNYLSTPEGTLMSDKQFVSQGYKENNWYGIEIECAYDPGLTSKNRYFNVNAWSANKIFMTGVFSGQGAITGSITNTGSSSSINVNLSNILNSTVNNSKSLKIGGGKDVVEVVGEHIDKNIKSNFFKDLWNNIKSNASKTITSGLESGAKKGLETILSGGASVAADAFKGLLTSFIGGGNNTSVSKVELDMKFDGQFTIEGETILNGWGSIQSLPIPGSSTNANYVPFYNKPLGVWNLDKTPVIVANIERISSDYRERCRTNIIYKQEVSKVILNPIIEQDFYVANFKQDLLIPASLKDLSPIQYPYLTVYCPSYENVLVSLKPYLAVSQLDCYYQGLNSHPHPGCLVRIHFQLINKKTNEKTYISKIFNVDEKIGSDNTIYLNDHFGGGEKD